MERIRADWIKRLSRLFKSLAWALALCLALTAACAGAEEAADVPQPYLTVSAVLLTDDGTAEVKSCWIDGEPWLFLPAFAKLDQLTLRVDGLTSANAYRWQTEDAQKPPAAFENGGEVNWRALSAEASTGEWVCALVDDQTNEKLTTLHVMRSANLRALFILSDDPVHYGQGWIDNCVKHENSASAAMALVSQAGTVDHAGHIAKLRGRGNSTWLCEKKSYQIKLDYKTDLLDTGIDAERNKTWVLLSNETDYTLLHNRVGFDLGLELGMTQTSFSESVDLYYDGDYRGSYLLCEKTEVGDGRVAISDYEKLIKKWNAIAGQTPLDELPVKTAVNRFGYEYTYVDGLTETDNPSVGSYLLEIESGVTLSDPCWFKLTNENNMVASKNPEHASQKMMLYISEALEEARQALINRGVNPETGLTAGDYFDLEAFARIALAQEILYNTDGYSYSSSFFALPAGSRRFEPGPLWDMDLSCRPGIAGNETGPLNIKDDNYGWLHSFYAVPEFQLLMQKIYQEELYPIMTRILLGTEQGQYLRPLGDYVAEIRESARMNRKRWNLTELEYLDACETYEEDVAVMRDFLTTRNEWLYQRIMAWRPTDPDSAILRLKAKYTLMEDTLTFEIDPGYMPCVNIRSYEAKKVSDATETDYAVWHLDAVIEPVAGYALGLSPSVTLNGTALIPVFLEDGVLQISADFDDLSYRPVDYYGDDVGLVYNYDDYIANHPEVLEAVGDDPEAVLDYFCSEGMSEGQKGNAFFDPAAVLLKTPQLEETLGVDWELYYIDFIAYGYEDWMVRQNVWYQPPVRDGQSPAA